MFKARVAQALVAVVMGVSGAVTAGTAHADTETAPGHAALQQACSEGGGRFELSWAYDDRGVRWGRVVSCSTDVGYITCQDNICRSGRRDLSTDMDMVDRRPDRGDGVMRFPAEPVAFSAALSALSGE